MRQFNGTITSIKSVFAQVQTAFGEITVEFDDLRIAGNSELKVGDHVSTFNVHRYPEPENGRTVFYIGDDTSVWVNGVHLPILPD